MSAAQSPTERLLRRDRVAVGHPEMRHPVQRRAPHQQLRRLPGERARTDSLAKDHLHAKDSRLGQRAPVVAALPLPRRPPLSPDRAQVLIADVPLRTRVAVLPDTRPLLRRDGRARPQLADRVIAVAAVIGPVGRDLPQLTLDLRKQVRQQSRVLERVGRDHGRHELMGGFIHAEVELAPRAATTPSVLAYLPFTFAVDFDARRVNHDVQRLALPPARQFDLQSSAAAAEGRVTGHAQRHAEQPEERARQALGGAQRQVINLFQRCHAEDGGVGVEDRLAALARTRRVVPRGKHLFADPQRQTSAVDESFVILTPVTETVLGLGFLAFHTSRLPALPSP